MFRGTICINRKKQLRQNIKQESWTLSIEFLTTIINAISVITNRVICTDYVHQLLNEIITKTTITRTSKSRGNVKNDISAASGKQIKWPWERGSLVIYTYVLQQRAKICTIHFTLFHIAIFAAWHNTLLLQPGGLFKDWVKMLSTYQRPSENHIKDWLKITLKDWVKLWFSFDHCCCLAARLLSGEFALWSVAGEFALSGQLQVNANWLRWTCIAALVALVTLVCE